MTRIRKVGVVGAGVMGHEVAMVLAQSNLHVVLVDIGPEPLRRARRAIERDLRFARMRGPANRSTAVADPSTVMEMITFVDDYLGFHDVDFVVENVTENEGVKRDVYAEIDRRCRPDTVFAANTSVIPITRLAGVTKRPERVVGMHFMNPVSRIDMVEVIRGERTSDESVDIAMELLGVMGKEGVVIRDSPGFVTNRVLMLTVNEAACLVHEGVADAHQVDRLFKGCFGHPMGPLETADLIGLETVLYSIEELYAEFGDNRYQPCPLLKKLVDDGMHGRKTGRGFYEYDYLDAKPRTA